MATEPLYPKVVVGYEENERGEDARVLAERVASRDGGELRVVHVEKGSPARRFEEIAERGDADLIVLGSTHRAHIGSIAPGSVAEHLLHGARCRLIIAPRGYARARAAYEAEKRGEVADDIPLGSPMPFVRDDARVLAVGWNATLEAQVALDEAAVLAERFGSTIRLIGVEEPVPPGAVARGAPPGLAEGGDFQAKLYGAAAELPEELRVLPVHEHGNAVEKLLERAGEGVDLLVLGSRGFGPVMRLLVGSVSAKVIREAPCPVLVVPRPAG